MEGIERIDVGAMSAMFQVVGIEEENKLAGRWRRRATALLRSGWLRNEFADRA